MTYLPLLDTLRLFTKIRFSLTYLPIYPKIWHHMWMLPNNATTRISQIPFILIRLEWAICIVPLICRLKWAELQTRKTSKSTYFCKFLIYSLDKLKPETKTKNHFFVNNISTLLYTLKFGLFKKGTKFEKIFHLIFDVTQ